LDNADIISAWKTHCELCNSGFQVGKLTQVLWFLCSEFYSNSFLSATGCIFGYLRHR